MVDSACLRVAVAVAVRVFHQELPEDVGTEVGGSVGDEAEGGIHGLGVDSPGT